MVKSQGSRVGKDRRLDGQGEDLGERDRVARTLERAQLGEGTEARRGPLGCSLHPACLV